MLLIRLAMAASNGKAELPACAPNKIFPCEVFHFSEPISTRPSLTFTPAMQWKHEKFNYFNVKSRWLREKNKTWSSCPRIMRIYGYFDAIKCKVWPKRPSLEGEIADINIQYHLRNYVSSSGVLTTITSTKVVLRNMFCIKLKSPHQHAKMSGPTD